MKKILIWVKIVSLIIVGATLGVAIFSFVMAKTLWFPDIKEVALDTGAGLSLSAYQYESWLWNKEKTTVMDIYDMKNDAPNFRYTVKGEVYSVRLIHSGEDIAVIAYSDPNFSSMESGYVVHRSPKSESENTIDEIHIGGNIIAVSPDESGYFYISQGKIFKRSWEGETILQAELGEDLESIVGHQLIGMMHRIAYEPVLFFSNNTKMAFFGRPRYQRDGFLFIWDLEKNKIEKISTKEKFPGYGTMSVQDDRLYLERTDRTVTVKKALVAE
ncbi:hypothetical protein KJ885_02765 [Patescibacteria group bacterium]|nr:hypothetical protein [Patescibacteria group bacterium]